MTTSIYRLLQVQARMRPRAIAVYGARGATTYGRLLQDVDHLAAELHQRGLRTGPAVVAFDRTYVCLLCLFALDRLGIPTLVMRHTTEQPPWSQEEPIPVLAADRPAWQCAHEWIEITEKWQAAGNPASPPSAPQSDSDLAHVILSSGSTGRPKAVPFARQVQIARIAEHIRDFALTRDSRWTTSNPMSSGPCYWACMATLAVGGMVMLLTEAQQFIQQTEFLGATHLTMAPAGLSPLLESLRGTSNNSGRFSKVQRLDVAGSLLPERMAAEARIVFTPNIYTTYGSTEAGRAASAAVGDIGGGDGAVGFVNPWAELEIIDGDGRALPSGEEGQIRIKNASATNSYYKDPELSAKAFRGGWFYPGDLGVVESSGILRIVGRADDLINVGGGKIAPVAIEEKLRAVPGVIDSAVFSVTKPDGATAAWAAVTSRPELDRQAIASLAARNSIERVVFPDHLPRNDNGKVVKRILSESAQQLLKA